MSFFAYIALCEPPPPERQRILSILVELGYRWHEVALAEEFGREALYGSIIRCEALWEIELTGHSNGDLEGALLEPGEAAERLWHYQSCAATLGIAAADFHASAEADALYMRTPIDLGIVALCHALLANIDARPIIINLDPDFALRFGGAAEIRGMENIRQIIWQKTAFSDLDEPLRLVLA